MQFHNVVSALVVLLLAPSPTCGFSSSVQASSSDSRVSSEPLLVLRSSSSSSSGVEAETAAPTKREITESLYFPLTFDDMVKQTSSTMQSAYEKGITRQIIRILLPRSADNDNLLQYFEDDAENEMGESVLVPPDETWQGGIMQLYRACSYSCQEILR